MNAVQTADVVKGVNARTEAAMETEDLSVDQGSEGQVIEKVGEIFPDIGVAVFSQTFVVEAVDLSDLTRFVVTSENGNAVRVSDFECNEEGNCFY